MQERHWLRHCHVTCSLTISWRFLAGPKSVVQLYLYQPIHLFFPPFAVSSTFTQQLPVSANSAKRSKHPQFMRNTGLNHFNLFSFCPFSKDWILGPSTLRLTSELVAKVSRHILPVLQ